MRVATRSGTPTSPLCGISIHATHAGGDMKKHGHCAGTNDFNPRHPCGWRPGKSTSKHSKGKFQSTPPMRVATYFILSLGGHTKYFNPRHPCGWRLKSASRFPSCPVFQSTPPMRVATSLKRQITSTNSFQSTPPMRVATRTAGAGIFQQHNFNPRHPCGWRR